MASPAQAAPVQGQAGPGSLARKTDINALARVIKLSAFRLATSVSYVAVGVVLYLGWEARDEGHLTAETGLGYWLGIVGGSMMLVLLLYPLRKKVRFMHALGPIRHWFRMHMIFGVLGPVLVLFHASFKFGSFNSSAALVATLLVATSGLFGRYFYSKIHYGLYGKCATLRRLTQDTQATREKLKENTTYAPRVIGRLETFEQAALCPPKHLLHSTTRFLVIGSSAWWTYLVLARLLRRDLRKEARARQWTARQERWVYRVMKQHIALHLAMVRKIVEFSFYERAFALWHVLHYPLFLILVGAGLIHVFAVHFY
ncbi:MAG: transcriptional regulator [Gammaproteobacteria bacterium]